MAPPQAKKDQSFAKLPVAGKVILLVLLVGIVTAGYYFALHMSLSDEIAAEEGKYAQLRADLTEAERRQQEFLTLTQELAARESIDRENKRILPEKAEIASFLEDINRLAELSGLDIRLVEPRPEETAEFYLRIPVRVGVTGRFHQVAKFFHNVSRLPRAINMENIRLAEPREQGEDVLLNVEVLATTFRRQEQPEAAAPGAAPAAAAAGGPR